MGGGGKEEGRRGQRGRGKQGPDGSGGCAVPGPGVRSARRQSVTTLCVRKFPPAALPCVLGEGALTGARPGR